MIINRYRIDGRTRLRFGDWVCLVRNKLVKQRYRKNPVGMFLVGDYSFGFVLVQGDLKELYSLIALIRKD